MLVLQKILYYIKKKNFYIKKYYITRDFWQYRRKTAELFRFCIKICTFCFTHFYCPWIHIFKVIITKKYSGVSNSKIEFVTVEKWHSVQPTPKYLSRKLLQPTISFFLDGSSPIFSNESFASITLIASIIF